MVIERDPTSPRRPHRIMVSVSLVALGVLLTGGALLLNEHRADAHARSMSDRDLEQAAAAMTSTFASAEEIATALASFVMSSESIEPLEYERFTRGFLENREEIQSLQLLDYVTSAERSSVEERLRSDGVSGITEMTSDSERRSAPRRDQYLITWFDAGRGDPGSPVGLNVWDGTVDRDLVQRLVAGHETGSTVLLLPSGESGASDSARLLRPVFDPGMPVDTPEDRARALVGAAAVVVTHEEMFSRVTEPVRSDTDIMLGAAPRPASARRGSPAAAPSGTSDGSGAPSSSTPGNGSEIEVLAAVVDGADVRDPTWSWPGSGIFRSVTVGDREMMLWGTPRSHLAAVAAEAGRRWILLIGALLTSAAVASYLWWSRVRRLERLARALEEANEHLERNAAEMQRVSERDQLTGLRNRNSMQRLVTEAVEDPDVGCVSVVLVDLDRFKELNDSLGHSRGDELLRMVAERLSASVRSGSLGRMGGDEFCVLLTDVDPGAAAVVAERLVSAMRRPFRVGDRTVSLTATAAACSDPSGVPDADGVPGAEGLMERVGVALHTAKEDSRDTWVVYDHSMARYQQRRRSIAAELRYALEGNGTPVLTHFQPKVDLASGRIVSAEGLARWKHPELGAVSPEEFIDVAEETGLIVGIGEEQITRALELLARCRGEGLEIDSVSVNVSAQQFGDERLVEHLRRGLADTEVPAGSLVLEITESQAMEGVDYGVLSERLETLASMGVGLSIDDFGTGYSSMSRVERLPVHEVKVDQSFVAGLPHRRVAVGITRAILSMAHTLGIRVVAEGVETIDQRDWLVAEGCDLAQGWLYARALDPDGFIGELRSQQHASVGIS